MHYSTLTYVLYSAVRVVQMPFLARSRLTFHRIRLQRGLYPGLRRHEEGVRVEKRGHGGAEVGEQQRGALVAEDEPLVGRVNGVPGADPGTSNGRASYI